MTFVSLNQAHSRPGQPWPSTGAIAGFTYLSKFRNAATSETMRATSLTHSRMRHFQREKRHLDTMGFSFLIRVVVIYGVCRSELQRM